MFAFINVHHICNYRKSADANTSYIWCTRPVCQKCRTAWMLRYTVVETPYPVRRPPPPEETPPPGHCGKGGAMDAHELQKKKEKEKRKCLDVTLRCVCRTWFEDTCSALPTQCRGRQWCVVLSRWSEVMQGFLSFFLSFVLSFFLSSFLKSQLQP